LELEAIAKLKWLLSVHVQGLPEVIMNTMRIKKCLLNVVSGRIKTQRGVSISALPIQKLEISSERKTSVSYKSIGTIGAKDSSGAFKRTLLYVPGLNPVSHMNGMKAICLLRFCEMYDYPCVVYDHECLGDSEGDKKKLLFSHWVEGLEKVINELTEGPVILVASGIGAWLSLLVARQMSMKQLHGMVLFSPAINNLWTQYSKQLQRVPANVAESLEDGDVRIVDTDYGEMLLKKALAEESRKYELDLNDSTQFDISGVPIRIVHGLCSSEMKVDDLKKLLCSLKSGDVDLLFRKDGDHEMEKYQDWELYMNTIDRLMKDYPTREIVAQSLDDDYDEDAEYSSKKAQAI